MEDKFAAVCAKGSSYLVGKLDVVAEDFTIDFEDPEALSGPRFTVRVGGTEMQFTEQGDTYRVVAGDGKLGASKALPSNPPKDLTDEIAKVITKEIGPL